MWLYQMPKIIGFDDFFWGRRSTGPNVNFLVPKGEDLLPPHQKGEDLPPPHPKGGGGCASPKSGNLSIDHRCMGSWAYTSTNNLRLSSLAVGILPPGTLYTLPDSPKHPNPRARACVGRVCAYLCDSPRRGRHHTVGHRTRCAPLRA